MTAEEEHFKPSPDPHPALPCPSQLAPDTRAVTVECEVSRERISLRNAYKAAGQRAAVRINSGMERHVAGGDEGEKHGGHLRAGGLDVRRAGAPRGLGPRGWGSGGIPRFRWHFWGGGSAEWEVGTECRPMKVMGQSGTRKRL